MAPTVDSGDRKDKLKKKGKSKHMDNASANGKVVQKSLSADGDRENKQWFEDRSPGDGTPINKFPVISQNKIDSPANKSWYEIVEEDENAEKMPLEESQNAGDAKVVMGVKIKQEKLDVPVMGAKIKEEKPDVQDSSKGKEEKNVPVPLIDNIKVEKDSKITIKKEKKDIKLTTQKTGKDLPLAPKKEEKPGSVGLKRERDVKSSLSSESDSDLKEKRIKQQKQERRSPRTPAKKPKQPEPAQSKEPASSKESIPSKGPSSSKDSSEAEPSAEDLKLARLSSMRKRNREETREGTRSKRERNHSTSTDNSSASRKRRVETDPATLARRQKQIDFGKNTVGYDRYLAQIPKEKRTNLHPRTPPKHQSYSRRAWDGMVKIWRQQLHIWDPPGADGEFDTMSELSTTNSSCHFSDDYTSTADSYDDGPDDCLDLGHE